MRVGKEEFLTTCLETSLQKKTRDMLYKVIVNGDDPLVVAKNAGVSRQTVYKAEKVFRVQYNKLKGLPSDWKQVDFLFSPELVRKIKQMQEDEIISLEAYVPIL